MSELVIEHKRICSRCAGEIKNDYIIYVSKSGKQYLLHVFCAYVWLSQGIRDRVAYFESMNEK